MLAILSKPLDVENAGTKDLDLKQEKVEVRSLLFFYYLESFIIFLMSY